MRIGALAWWGFRISGRAVAIPVHNEKMRDWIFVEHVPRERNELIFGHHRVDFDRRLPNKFGRQRVLLRQKV